MNTKDEIFVWDIVVRGFHWGLVIAFTVAYLSSEDESIWHIYAGYSVMGLVCLRILWGMIGTEYARFSHFIYTPKRVGRYLKSLLTGQPEHYLGHNPAGGWMILALLFCLIVTIISGLKIYAIEEGRGPFAYVDQNITMIAVARADDHDHEKKTEADNKTRYNDQHAAEEFWEELHEIAANTLLFLIIIHIMGVFIASWMHDEHLIRAMITGTKRNPANKKQP
jgi:cytochrome b